ncbi:hypothetical protein GCM10023224_08630 [Streptomonospora halophila]|uniref:Uncharacterized protein n=1 Tax=Streptomonospora halophila TaxID=427369 RepID=A0ABP9G6X2_9ACTN
MGDPAHQERRTGRAQGEQGGGQPGQAAGLQHLLGQQRADRDPGGQAGAAQNLGGGHGDQSAALKGSGKGIGIAGFRGGGGHVRVPSKGQVGV